MLADTLRILFTRDLKRLTSELELYKNEANIWKIKGEITNSAGHLCLHLVGNLNTYIGKELAGTGYVRNRELEFSSQSIPREELIKKIEDTTKIIDQAFKNFKEDLMQGEYPVVVFEHPTSTEHFFVHLTTHLSYHLGQINYHRRLIESDRR